MPDPAIDLETPRSDDATADEDQQELDDFASDGRRAVVIPEAMRAHLVDIAGRVAEIEKKLDLDDKIDAEIRMDSTERKGPPPDPQVRVLEQASKDLQQLREAVQEMRNKYTADKRKIWYMRWKFWAFVLGAVATGTGLSALIYQVAVARRDPDALSDDEKDQIRQQAERWRKMPDHDYWNAWADLCDRWNPSWPSQLFFMDYSQELKPMSECTPSSWEWKSDQHEYDLTLRVANAYADQADSPRRSGVVYRQIADLTYPGDPQQPGVQVNLPRWVAADVAKLAITYIINANAMQPVQK